MALKRWLIGCLAGCTPFGRIFAIVGGVTVLAGLLLYVTRSPGLMSTPGNIVLGLGALAGIAAAGHGGSAVGKQSEAYHQAALTVEKDSTSENVALMEQVGAKLKRSSMASLIMVIVALVFMSSARYL